MIAFPLALALLAPTFRDDDPKPTGKEKPAKAVELRNLVEGQTVILSLVPEGTAVKKGEVIGELDSAGFRNELIDQQIAVKQAEVDVLSARSKREIAESEAKEEAMVVAREITQQKDRIKLAETGVSVANAKLEEARKAKMASRIGPAEAAKSKADKDLKDQQFQLKTLQEVAGPRRIQEADNKAAAAKTEEVLMAASLAAEQAKEKKLRQQIDRCKLVAPAAGMVLYANPSDAPAEPPPIEEGRDRAGTPGPGPHRAELRGKLAGKPIDSGRCVCDALRLSFSKSPSLRDRGCIDEKRDQSPRFPAKFGLDRRGPVGRGLRRQSLRPLGQRGRERGLHRRRQSRGDQPAERLPGHGGWQVAGEYRRPLRRGRRPAGDGLEAVQQGREVQRLPQDARREGQADRRRGGLHARSHACRGGRRRDEDGQARLLREAARAFDPRGEGPDRDRRENEGCQPDGQSGAVGRQHAEDRRDRPLGRDRPGQGSPRVDRPADLAARHGEAARRHARGPEKPPLGRLDRAGPHAALSPRLRPVQVARLVGFRHGHLGDMACHILNASFWAST